LLDGESVTLKINTTFYLLVLELYYVLTNINSEDSYRSKKKKTQKTISVLQKLKKKRKMEVVLCSDKYILRRHCYKNKKP